MCSHPNSHSVTVASLQRALLFFPVQVHTCLVSVSSIHTLASMPSRDSQPPVSISELVESRVCGCTTPKKARATPLSRDSPRNDPRRSLANGAQACLMRYDVPYFCLRGGYYTQNMRDFRTMVTLSLSTETSFYASAHPCMRKSYFSYT